MSLFIPWDSIESKESSSKVMYTVLVMISCMAINHLPKSYVHLGDDLMLEELFAYK